MTKSSYLLSPMHEMKPLASERFSLDEMRNFFSVKSVKNHYKSCFVCRVFFNNVLLRTLFSKSSALFMYPLALCILLTLSLTEVPVSISRILCILPSVLMHYM